MSCNATASTKKDPDQRHGFFDVMSGWFGVLMLRRQLYDYARQENAGLCSHELERPASPVIPVLLGRQFNLGISSPDGFINRIRPGVMHTSRRGTGTSYAVIS